MGHTEIPAQFSQSQRVARVRPGCRGRFALPPLLAALCWLSLSTGCAAQEAGDSPRRVGGPCEYRDVPGTCRVDKVEPAGANPYGDGFRTLFTFLPESPSEPETSGLALKIGDGQDPTNRFLRENRIEPGRSLPCLRRVLVRGTCTPVVYTFPGLEDVF